MPNKKIGNQYLVTTDPNSVELLETLDDVRENLESMDDCGDLNDEVRVYEIVRELKVKKEFKIYEK